MSSAILTPKVADPSEGVIRALKEEVRWAHDSMMASAKPHESETIRASVFSYQPKLDQHTYSCPSCWMRRGQRAPMRPAPGTDDYDLLNCNSCGNNVIIPF